MQYPQRNSTRTDSKWGENRVLRQRIHMSAIHIGRETLHTFSYSLRTKTVLKIKKKEILLLNYGVNISMLETPFTRFGWNRFLGLLLFDSLLFTQHAIYSDSYMVYTCVASIDRYNWNAIIYLIQIYTLGEKVERENDKLTKLLATPPEYFMERNGHSPRYANSVILCVLTRYSLFECIFLAQCTWMNTHYFNDYAVHYNTVAD